MIHSNFSEKKSPRTFLRVRFSYVLQQYLHVIRILQMFEHLNVFNT